MTLFKRLFRDRKEKKPVYGWSIFALDDSIHLTRRVTEAQRKQMQQLP
jgi:hypothetical protein